MAKTPSLPNRFHASAAAESARKLNRSRRAFRPETCLLEDRVALSAAQSASLLRPAPEVISFRHSLRDRTLEIRGSSGADTVEVGRNARGLISLTVNGRAYSADPRDRAAFDRRLVGLRADRLQGVRLIGSDPLDTVVMQTAIGNGKSAATVQSHSVTISTAVSTSGVFRLDAQNITIAAPVQADAIILTAKGLMNIDAFGSLTAATGISLNADRLVQTGKLQAQSLSIQANVLIRSGTITAPGGSVNVDFKENYVATEGAGIDVSGAIAGGSIRIDGGATGHLFNSGTLLAKGADKGGSVRVSGKDVVWVAGGADASGGASGGLVHIGGDWQGADTSMTRARTLQVSPHTVITANGSQRGGTVVLWSDESTTNYGTISATGAKGGAVEVSSKSSLAHGGSVDVGPGGRFLLDPKNIVIADNAVTGVPQFQLVNPTPSATDNFGAAVVPLSTGNVLVTDPGDDSVAANGGAFYLYNGITGALISTMTGSTANDEAGSAVMVLTNGNFVVRNYFWDNGAAIDAGAVTWGSGTSGVSGVVSASNSLVGSSSFDYIGGSVMTALSSGNYVVRSSSWNGARGAVTWGNGTSGTSGVVSSSNSLVGSTAGDSVGSSDLFVLPNGNYIVIATGWDNGATSNAGAVTWGSGTSGVAGVVSSSNSLVGSNSGDQVGSTGITTLTNGNFIVRSNAWNGTRGAVTWGSGTAGITGTLSSSNSLVGSTAGDQVGVSLITQLTNGNFVLGNTSWNGNRGAVTWGSGTSGVSGVVSDINSLVGSTAGDQVGGYGVTALTNGNYVVGSAGWNGARGAATWGNGMTGIIGNVSSTNSLVGSTANDSVGFVVTRLPNGNYVVSSRLWDNGSATDAGAVTWGSGTTGVKGFVSDFNSLVGSTANDRVGAEDLKVLSNSNYVILSPDWDNSTTVDAGAVTWGSGIMGATGVISSTKSLVGSMANDRVGSYGVTALPNGNYVVRILNWNGNRGAVTWGSGTSGVSGVVSASNSLVGSMANDLVGGFGISPLSNGNYLVSSPDWNGSRGAVTWVNGTTGLVAMVSADNSLVGSTANDQIGSGGVIALMNGNYVVRSLEWDNGSATNAGAVTWGSGTSGVKGVVSASNSLIGSASGDQIGSYGVSAFPNGNYTVHSPAWDNGTTANTGALTWGSGTTGVIGVVSSANSLVGSTDNERVGYGLTPLGNGNYVLRIQDWGFGSGAVTWWSGTSGVTGVVSSANSLVGSTFGDFVGSSGVTVLSNGNYVVGSSGWDNGSLNDAGAVTWGSGTSGVSGVVSASNSLVGSTANDQVGIVTVLSNGNYVVRSLEWDNGAVTDAGAVTWGSGTSGIVGVVSAANSLVGTTAFDRVGSGGITVLANGNYIVNSPLWDNGAAVDAAAVTWVRGTDGSLLSGVTGQAVGVTNSFTGSPTRIDDPVNGTYLMRYSASGGSVFAGLPTPVNAMTFGTNPATSTSMSPALVATPLSAGTATTLQANNDITLSNALIVNNPSGNGGALTLQAGRTVFLNAILTTDNANLTLLGNASASDGVVDAQRDAGVGGVIFGTSAVIDAGSGAVSLSSGTATGLTNRTSNGVTVNGTLTAGSVAIVTADSGSGTPGVTVTGTIAVAGPLTIQSDGPVNFTPSSSVTGVTGGSIVTSNDPVSIASAFVQPPNFPFTTGSGSISFSNAWTIGPQVATLNTSVAVGVAGNLSIDGGVVLAMTAGVSVSSTGSLTGKGTFFGQVSVAGGLAPGNGGSGVGSGLLNLATGALTLAGTSTVTMNGTTKTAFDKVAAIGVNLAGATLALDLSAATLNAGDSITLVDNISASATAGTFAGLAQGALFTANGHTMQISYAGGDGNDVVVTKVGDITASFAVNRSGFMYVDASDSYWQLLTLTNTSLTAKKPRTLKFVGLPDRVSVVGGTKIGPDWFLNVGEPSVSPTGSVGLPVYFQVTSGGAFAYALEVIGG